MQRCSLAALAVLLALLALPFWVGRSPSAPLPPADEQLAQCPPLADVEQLLPEGALRDWEEQQTAYLGILKPKVERMERDQRAGRRIDEGRLDTYRELLDDTNRRVRFREFMQGARDQTLSVRERRHWLKALRDQFPEGYPGRWGINHPFPPAIPDELRQEWDAAALALCPPLSDADRLPSKETLDQWDKRESCFKWVLEDKMSQVRADYVAGRPVSSDRMRSYERYSELDRRANPAEMICELKTARDPQERPDWRRGALRGLRLDYPAEYMARRWPAPPDPPVPSELREAYRQALADYPASVNRLHMPRR